jgi:23S rRNA (cytidine1920-2'-O)/16S rRNA (cytidine1409-2'-O)-methyltransferase
MTKMRADLLLVRRGLAESRAQAQLAIEAGGVRANGAPVRKASELVSDDAALEFERPHPWVSRGGVKLAAALDTFGIDPVGRVCMDLGASTGGFTHVLLERGAAKVFAVDVGHGQLHASLQSDPRVVNLERTDARTLTRGQISIEPSLIVCDVSFIGAAKALRRPLSLAAERADLVVLIKPQFETGPRVGKHGVLDEAAARAAAHRAAQALNEIEGFRIVAMTDSPIRGGDGNLEILAHARR